MDGDDDDDNSSVNNRIEGKLKAAVLCWFFGTSSAFAWNTMLNISDFYSVWSPGLQHYPSRVFALVYQPVALATIVLLAYYEAKLSTCIRIMLGYIISGLCTATLLIVDLMEFSMSRGAGTNYRVVCALVGILGGVDASVQGGFVGDLSLMDPTLLQSFFGGLATSGALTSMLKLFTKGVYKRSDDGLRYAACLFLFISTVNQFVSMFLYGVVFINVPIVKHYRKKAALEGSKTVLHDLQAAGLRVDEQQVEVGDAQDPDRLSKKALICQNLDLALDLLLIYGLTFFIFPALLFKETAHNQLESWYGVVLVALYNIFDVIGRCITLVEFVRLDSRKGLMAACFSRLSLAPCFYFTAMYGGRGWMALLVPFLGLTNGYLTVCALVVAPRGYRAPERNALGNMLYVFLLGGAFVGVVLDYLWLVGVLSL